MSWREVDSDALTRSNRLGQALTEAREARGLDLLVMANELGLRSEYLRALEAGDYASLPGDPYTRNMVRDYARRVGSDPARMLLLYTQERRVAERGAPSDSKASALDIPLEGGHVPLLASRAYGRFVSALVTLLVLAAIVWGALYIFEVPLPGVPFQVARQDAGAVSARAREDAKEGAAAAQDQTQNQVPNQAQNQAQAGQQEQGERRAAPSASLRTHVPADPAADVPPTGNASAGASKAATAPPAVAAEKPKVAQKKTPAQPQATAAVVTKAQRALPAVELLITAPAWLEVYSGNARGEGQRLLYETAAAGQRFTFKRPVFIFTGNAGGVSVNTGGAAKQLGADGEVLERYFGEAN